MDLKRLSKWQSMNVSKISNVRSNVKGMLQIISKNYGRVRHYTGLDPLSKKPMFQYHRQSKEYTEQKLRESRSNQILDQSGQLFIDPNLLNLGLSEQKRRACSSVRTEHQPPKLGVVGSNPTTSATSKTRSVPRYSELF